MRFADKERGLTAELLRESLHYDPATGEFTWVKAHKMAPVAVGQRAGFICTTNGYERIKFRSGNDSSYFAHRLAWLYMTGEWPSDRLDHINGDKSDNRFENLREATHAQNMQNSAPYKKRLPLPKGVFMVGKRYGAQIRFDKERIYLGSFDTPSEAHDCYIAKAKELHGAFFKEPSNFPLKEAA